MWEGGKRPSLPSVGLFSPRHHCSCPQLCQVREAHALTPWSLRYLLGRRWSKRAESLCKMTGQQPLRRTG